MSSLQYILDSESESEDNVDQGKSSIEKEKEPPTQQPRQLQQSGNPPHPKKFAKKNSSSTNKTQCNAQPNTPTTAAKQPTKNESSKKTTAYKSRRGKSNYNIDEVSLLLDIVAEHEPTGANGWARVAQEFNEDIRIADKTLRTADSLKDKFDRLIHVRKPTGDPTCPPLVRRAKQIHRDLQAKVVAAVLGPHDDHINPSPDELNNARERTGVVGERKNKRSFAPTGLPVAKRFQQDIVRHTELTSKGIADVANWITKSRQPFPERAPSTLSAADIRSIVRSELQDLNEENKLFLQNTATILRNEVVSTVQPLLHDETPLRPPSVHFITTNGFATHLSPGRPVDASNLIVAHQHCSEVEEMARDADNIKAVSRVRRQYGLQSPERTL